MKRLAAGAALALAVVFGLAQVPQVTAAPAPEEAAAAAPVFSVMDYGAKADGSSNDSATVEKAITAAAHTRAQSMGSGVAGVGVHRPGAFLLCGAQAQRLGAGQTGPGLSGRAAVPGHRHPPLPGR